MDWKGGNGKRSHRKDQNLKEWKGIEKEVKEWKAQEGKGKVGNEMKWTNPFGPKHLLNVSHPPLVGLINILR